ncbi:hypothetical protein [Streptomyces sp. NPDC007883]|uniref:hypothetical protein n=1 Tax=Streptomyces sp. NPDC007883 TaxID=3155116 RepID=UPI0033ED0BE8
MPLTRMDMVDEDAVLDLAGPDVCVFPVPGAVVALGESGTVIIAEAGDDAAISGVWNDEQFLLIGPAPQPVSARLMGPMPFTAVEKGPGPPIHLAIRVDVRCLYLGVVQVGMCKATEDELSLCRLWIEPPLSRETLAVVRPPVHGAVLPGLQWLQYVEDDPRHALELFVTGWYTESGPAPSSSPVPKFVPPALAHFYRLAERRPDILGQQNFIEPPADLASRSHGERMVFAVENQGGWDWSIPWQPDAGDIDPAVALTTQDVPVPEQEPLSRFLLQFSLHEAAVTAPYQAGVRGPAEQLMPLLESLLQRVPLLPFMSPIVPKTFLAGPGVIAQVSSSRRHPGAVTVGIGAHHRSALQPFGRLDIEWRGFDG